MRHKDYFRIPTRLHKTMRLYRPYARHEADELFATPAARSTTEETVHSQQFIGTFLSDTRLWIFWWGIVGVLSILLFRLGYLQLYVGSEYLSRAERNRLITIHTPASRGFIYDAHGVLLVQNRARFTLSLAHDFIPELRNERRELLDALIPYVVIDTLVQEDFLSLEKDSEEIFIFADDLAYEEMLRISSEQYRFPHIKVISTTERLYSSIEEAASLAHVMGYLGEPSEKEADILPSEVMLSETHVGKTGLEKQYDKELRGTGGSLVYEVNAFGERGHTVSQDASLPGLALTLTLDYELQKAAEKALRTQLRNGGKKRGAVVALDPRDGAVKALVSLPTYDPNLFAQGIEKKKYADLLNNEDQPLFPRALAGTYPSGSTFKLITSYAGLMEGVITSQTTIWSTGGIAINQWFFPDWKAGGHGATNLRKAIAESVNTYFYTVGGGYENQQGVGADALARYAALFGLSAPLGIDLPVEAAGLIPTPSWKEATKNERWYIGDTYHFAIGQGDVLVTPLQVAAYTSVFANGDTLYRPHLVLSFKDPVTDETITRFKSKVSHDFSDTSSEIQAIRNGMRAAVTQGSARGLSLLPIQTAGKTGTAQWHSTKENHAWFTGFAPYEQSEIVVTVLIEEGGEGSSAAVPVAREIFEWYAKHRAQQ